METATVSVTGTKAPYIDPIASYWTCLHGGNLPGCSPSLKYRMVILLDVQVALAAAIAATGTPTVVVLINGGMVDMEALKTAHNGIVSTGYPGFWGAKVRG